MTIPKHSFKRSHWSNLKTVAVTVRVLCESAKVLGVLRVAAVMDINGGRYIVLEGGSKNLPLRLQGLSFLYTGYNDAVQTSIPGDLRPISMEVIAPYDILVLESQKGHISVRPLRCGAT